MRFNGIVRQVSEGLVVLLLVSELIIVYGIGSLLGALGEADDANGPVLLIGPLSILISLFAIWLFGAQKPTWLLAGVVFAGPLWSSSIFGRASESNFWPFWGEGAAALTLTTWILVSARAQVTKAKNFRPL